jgi:hypothetical protein
MIKKRSKRIDTLFTSPGRKESRLLGWPRLFLLYVCLLCILNTLFFVPAGASQLSTLPSQEDHSLLKLVLELENYGSTGEPNPDIPEEMDDMVKKVEFIVSSLVLVSPTTRLSLDPNNYHTFLIRAPFLSLLTPPPKV